MKRTPTGLGEVIAALPRWRRTGMRLLLALGQRRRGQRMLAWIAPLDQAIAGLLALGRYDSPDVSRALGWDPEAVVSRAGRRASPEDSR